MQKRKIINIKAQMLSKRKESIADFSDIEHRLNTIAKINDVEWINDSKATDISATCFSMEVIEDPIVWIVGSNRREKDLNLIEKIIKDKVCKIICYGAFDTSIKYAFTRFVDKYAYKSTLEDAVNIAAKWSDKGDVVLFSPACTSYPNYIDYRERGDHFIELIKMLK